MLSPSNLNLLLDLTTVYIDILSPSNLNLLLDLKTVHRHFKSVKFDDLPVWLIEKLNRLLLLLAYRLAGIRNR